MAAAGGSTVAGAKSDKKWHGSLMHKISKMLTKNDFKKLKHLFYITEQVARTDIDESDDVFLFLALLERRDHISVGRYDVLIDHLETLELNDCIRVIREHTEEIIKCRQAHASGGATSGTEEGLLESRQLQMMEELVDKKLQDGTLSKQMIEDLINKKLHGQLSKQTVEDLVHKKFQEFQASENQTRQVTKVRYVAPPSANVNKHDETRQVTKTRYVAPPSADVNRYEEGKTPLMRAAENNDVVSVRSLIEAGADLDMKSGKKFVFALQIEWTALMLASERGHTGVVAELIKAGANVDIQNTFEWTALILASDKGHTRVVAELIKAGANVDIQDTAEWTALMLASGKGHTEVVAELIKAGANVDIQGWRGYTALILAAFGGHKEVVAKLIESDADLNIRDKNGFTALIQAAMNGHKDVVAKLIESGADLNIRDERSGMTALGWAIDKGHREIAEMLKRADASE